MLKRRSVLVYFFVGVSCGFVFAVGQLGTVGLGFTKYPEPVFGLWMLIGGLFGLLVAGFNRVYRINKLIATAANCGERKANIQPPAT
ncbi:hypothetical protein BH10PLA2_BH10PLA2_37510 [soil metagenome]